MTNLFEMIRTRPDNYDFYIFQLFLRWMSGLPVDSVIRNEMPTIWNWMVTNSGKAKEIVFPSANLWMYEKTMNEIERKRCRPMPEDYECMIGFYFECLDLEKMNHLWNDMMKNHLPPTFTSYLYMIRALFTDVSQISKAESIFSSFLQRNFDHAIYGYRTMMTLYFEREMYEKVEKVYMLHFKMEPKVDSEMHCNLIKVAFKIGQVGFGWKLFLQLMKWGYRRPVDLYSYLFSIILKDSKERFLPLMEYLFSEDDIRITQSIYQNLIIGCVVVGAKEKLRLIHSEMVKRGDPHPKELYVRFLETYTMLQDVAGLTWCLENIKSSLTSLDGFYQIAMSYLMRNSTYQMCMNTHKLFLFMGFPLDNLAFGEFFQQSVKLKLKDEIILELIEDAKGVSHSAPYFHALIEFLSYREVFASSADTIMETMKESGFRSDSKEVLSVMMAGAALKKNWKVWKANAAIFFEKYQKFLDVESATLVIPTLIRLDMFDRAVQMLNYVIEPTYEFLKKIYVLFVRTHKGRKREKAIIENFVSSIYKKRVVDARPILYAKFFGWRSHYIKSGYRKAHVLRYKRLFRVKHDNMGRVARSN